ncbi:MAG: hypothetical protein SFX73_38320 [Kofleriaceae bacterium]|nr:hypothetical protein [Kofleriaceae bacterium]
MMITKTRCGTLALLLLAAGACAKEKGGAESTGSGSGSSTVVATGSGSAGSGSAGLGSAAPAPVVPGAKTVPSGPHASIDAYCTAVRASVAGSEACKYGPDEDLCGCDAVTKDDVSGSREAKGTGPIQAATFVRVARSSSDYQSCELALQLADGWYVHHKTFDCGPAPAGMGEGHSTDLKITRLAIEGDTVELAWTTTESSYDVDKQREIPEKPTNHALSCKLGADRAITCTGK